MNYKKIFALFMVGVVILLAMIGFIGPDEIVLALKSANMKYVLIAVLIQIFLLVLWAVRWSIISKSLDIKHRKLPLFAMTLLGLTVNEITPSGRAGGEPVRAYLLGKESGEPFKKTFASVMGDKIFDTFPFAILAVVALLYLIFTIKLSESITATLIGILIIFVALLAIIIYACINENFANRIIRGIFSIGRRLFSRNLDVYEKRVLDAVSEFQENLRVLMADRNVFIASSIISFLSWFLELVRVYFVFLAFGTEVSLGMIASVFLVSTLVGMIPTLPGGVGAIDGVMILIYSVAGISPFVSTASTLIERLISFWFVAILGLLTLPYFGTKVLDEVNFGDEEK